MYSASSGSVQPLPTSTWYKYSSWPKDSSTSLRPQFGLYIPHFVLERGGEREREMGMGRASVKLPSHQGQHAKENYLWLGYIEG